MVAPALPEPDYEVSSSPSSPKMPDALSQEITQLEKWANSNNSAAKSDSKMFWVLKGPAIFVSATSGALSYFELSAVATIAATISGIVILFDGVIKPGIQRGAHYLAFYEARELQNTVVTRWRKESLKSGADANEIASNLLGYIEEERKRISENLKKVEGNSAE